MKRIATFAALLFIAAACSTADDPPDYGLDNLTADLQEFAETPVPEATLLGAAPGPLQQIDSTVMSWNGETIRTYEFSDLSSARDSESLFSLDALTVEGREVQWQATPHIFRKGRLLVIYDGDDRPTIDAIRRAMGAQFAGGHAPDEEFVEED